MIIWKLAIDDMIIMVVYGLGGPYSYTYIYMCVCGYIIHITYPGTWVLRLIVTIFTCGRTINTG